MKMLLAAASTVMVVLYPLLVYLGLSRFEPRVVALLLCLVLVLRLLQKPGPGFLVSLRYRVLLALAAVLLVVVTLINNHHWGLKLYPVVVNLAFLLIFAWSLRYPPSIIERLARLREPELPVEAQNYTRRVTQVWCVFFICNGLVALYTALFSSLAIWTLYNGLIAYVLMGLLFGAEFLYRHCCLRQRKGR